MFADRAERVEALIKANRGRDPQSWSTGELSFSKLSTVTGQCFVMYIGRYLCVINRPNINMGGSIWQVVPERHLKAEVSRRLSQIQAESLEETQIQIQEIVEELQ